VNQPIKLDKNIMPPDATPTHTSFPTINNIKMGAVRIFRYNLSKTEFAEIMH
jgi:hypothetical protein